MNRLHFSFWCGRDGVWTSDVWMTRRDKDMSKIHQDVFSGEHPPIDATDPTDIARQLAGWVELELSQEPLF